MEERLTAGSTHAACSSPSRAGHLKPPKKSCATQNAPRGRTEKTCRANCLRSRSHQPAAQADRCTVEERRPKKAKEKESLTLQQPFHSCCAPAWETFFAASLCCDSCGTTAAPYCWLQHSHDPLLVSPTHGVPPLSASLASAAELRIKGTGRSNASTHTHL